jgi:hypothetical protein
MFFVLVKGVTLEVFLEKSITLLAIDDFSKEINAV